MKRTIIAAALIAGTFMSAHADYVASDNIYGIINVPIVAGYNAVGVNLLPISGSPSLMQNIVLPEGLTSGNDLTSGDNLCIWNGAGYTEYWYNALSGWTNNAVPFVVPTVAPGTAAWIKRPPTATAVTLYQIGIAVDVDPTAVAVSAGNNFIANPFPFVLELNGDDVTWANTFVSFGKYTQSKADLIRVWNGATYDTYWYYNHASYPLLAGWYKGNTKATVAILPGEGFWFYRRDAALGTTPIPVNSPFPAE